MRTVQEIDLDQADVYEQRQALNRRLTELAVERLEAQAAARFVKLPSEERDAFAAKVEAEEAAKAEEAALAEAAAELEAEE